MIDPSDGGGFRWWRQPRISWFVYMIIIFISFVSIVVHFTRDRRESRYSVVFEARENSTRVQLFRLDWREGYWNLLAEEYGSTSPGLLDYIDSPREGVYSLKLLFEQAINAIPESHQAVSTVSLGVTELFHHLQRENDPRIEQLFGMIYRLLFRARSSPFHKAHLVFINETQEVAYTWSAISLLRNTRGNHIAVLNLGRYRCQICFVPETMNATTAFDRFRKRVDLYVANYERLGIDNARTEILGKSRPGTCDSHSAPGPKFMECLEAVKNHLDDVGVEPMPDLRKKTIYVRGFFFNFAVYANLIQEHENRQTIKVLYIGSRARAACEDRRRGAASICFELTYMYALFTQGYSLDDEDELVFVRRVEIADASWTLGLAISHVYD
ncbi:ectonucleoside triphosphate diphosphohydrolase 5 [Galendromus occidentalis]|uniref:Ectonucleoside triphosphate diphosphohydrolase 5 n=1 Tax=Galendromus occidentalis TaxID=34638 RepID=A0AAJ6QWD7_9ACAR|nr:ectonucleoside triphosphate diphosphohydrolase 5 [Galendromus occidentalis]